jgi:hypothetical protein
MEQLLLNIVRLRFVDSPYFLEVSSISATSEIGAAFGGNQMDTGVGGGIGYLERPTIIYSPLTGEDFVRRLLNPVDLRTIALLGGAGWEIDDAFRVFVNRINGIPNAPTGAGPTPDRVPEFETFLELVEIFDDLDDGGEIVVAESENPDELVMHIMPRAHGSPSMKRMAELLDLDPAAKSFRVRMGLMPGNDREIVIETRPILSAMFYLGHSIQIPEEVQAEGLVNTVIDDDGEIFDWSPIHENLIRINSSEKRPGSAYVSVNYGGYWYYVAANDVDSKEVLAMMRTVFSLLAGGEPSKKPVLTLPVGQ